jgi:hypothetical protein
MGDGQTGVFAATPLVGGMGDGQTGVFTATPLVGGMGDGQTGVVTFPCWAKIMNPGFGLAAEMVTTTVKKATKAIKRKFSMEEFIESCPLWCNGS